MQKISVAIIGWGNVGRGCKRAIKECSDMMLAGVVRRPVSLGKIEPELEDTNVVADISKLDRVDVALLCIPSREVPERIKLYHGLGIATVDSFDEHERLVALKREADISAKAHKTVSVMGAGWDPGTDSVVRALMRIVSISGHTTTTFGGDKGGRSMGHTALVKTIPGVKNAVALTFANGRGHHKRKVYVELLPQADLEAITQAIKADPYFRADPTEVLAVKDINKFNTLNHSVSLERTGMQVNQNYVLAGVNPEFTANVMVSAARACITAKEQNAYGAYTLLERPLIDFLPGATLDEKLAGY